MTGNESILLMAIDNGLSAQSAPQASPFSLAQDVNNAAQLGSTGNSVI